MTPEGDASDFPIGTIWALWAGSPSATSTRSSSFRFDGRGRLDSALDRFRSTLKLVARRLPEPLRPEHGSAPKTAERLPGLRRRQEGVHRLWETPGMQSALVGFGLGFFVALQLGPMSLFLIRSTLRGGWKVGLAIGAGIAIVDGLYAAAGAAGAAPLLSIEPVRLALGLAGAAVLLFLGVRTLYAAFRVRLGVEVDAEVASPKRAFLTSLGGTASNPSTIVSWAAIFAAASTAGATATTGAAVLLVAGVAIGSLTWVSVLATGSAVARRAVGERAIRLADAVAGLGLVGFGGLLAYTTTHEH